jgi:hypothetical protein
MFTKDFEDDLYELQGFEGGGGNSTVVAKRDIPKGTITGMYDAAIR